MAAEWSTQELVALTSAVGVVVSGVVALVATWLAHVFAAKREDTKIAAESERLRRTFLRAKLEEMLSLLGEHIQERRALGEYIFSMGIYAGQGKPVPDSLKSPVMRDVADRAEAIANLYFPELRTAFGILSDATLAHQRLIGEELNAIGADGPIWYRNRRPDCGSRFGQQIALITRSIQEIQRQAKVILDSRLAP